MKKNLFLFLSFFLLIIFGGGFSYAQECPACNAAPQELQEYIDTMNASIQQLLYTPQLQKSDADLSNVIQSTKNALNQYQVMMAVAEILATTPGDVFADMKLLAGSAERKRDRDKLLKIDQMISNQLMTMISRDGLLSKVSVETATKLDASLQKFGGGMLSLKKDDKGNYNIVSQQRTNGDLAGFLWSLNMTIKKFHSERWYTRFLADQGKNLEITLSNPNEALSGQIAQQKELMKKVDRFVSDWWDGVAKTKITKNGQRSENLEWVSLDMQKAILWIWVIESKYQCANGLTNECGKLQQIRNENWKLAKDQIVTNSSSAWTTIKEASVRLAQFISKSGGKDAQEKIQQRKNALLQSYWGSDVDRRIDNGYVNRSIQAAGSLRKKIRGKEQKSQDPVNYNNPDELFGAMTLSNLKETIGKPDPKTFKEIEAKRKYIKEVREEAKTEIPIEILGDANLNSQSNARQEALIRSREYLRQSILDTLQLQQKLKESSVFSDVGRVTREFPKISRKAYETIHTIGLKNQKGEQNEGTLVNSMGHVCELQCTNAAGECWWMED